MIEIEPLRYRTWSEIDLDAAEHNFECIKTRVTERTKVCCVVKANAYGHGAVQLSKLYEKLGADFLAVSNIEEALQLRNEEISVPIIILGYTNPRCATYLAKYNISQSVFSQEYATQLSSEAMKQNVNVKIHIKIDTGMGRIGFQCREKAHEYEAIFNSCELPGLIPEGIFTHFASADEGEHGEEYTRKQFFEFAKAIRFLEERGCCFAIHHCANSAALFDYPEMHMDMVRAGIVLYGVQPSSDIKEALPLMPVLKLKTIVTHIKDIGENDSISYGREYVATQPTKIATIPIGYADGLWRANAKNGMVVQVEGKTVPIVGRICMDQCMIDISGAENVRIGSEVTIYGEGDLSVDNVAEGNKTINYEILCAVGARVPRIYLRKNECVAITDVILNCE